MPFSDALLCTTQGLINIFKVSSTWLTVNMAVGRYIAICHPLHARGYIGQRGTLAAVAAIFLGSVLFNLPRFWHYRISRTPCHWLLRSSSTTHFPSSSTSGLISSWSSAAVTTSLASSDVTTTTFQQFLVEQFPSSSDADCECYYYWKVFSICNQALGVIVPTVRVNKITQKR